MRIPTYSLPTVAPQAAPQAFQRVETATPEAFGEGPAIGIGRIGAAVARAGDMLGAQAVKLQEVENETAVNDTYANRFSPAVRDVVNEVRGLQGKAAVEAFEPAKQRIEKIREETRKDLNPTAARMFDQLTRRHVDLELDRIAGHAAAQKRVWRTQTHESTLKNYLDEASDKFNDPGHVERLIRSGRAEIEAYAVEAGHDAETVKQRERAFSSAVRGNVVDRLLNASPGAAQAYYKAHLGEFDAADKVRLERTIRARQEHLTALARSRLRDGLDEANLAISQGVLPDVALAQKNYEQAKALGDERTAARWNVIATKGATLAEFGTLPLADQARAVQEKYDAIADPAKRDEGALVEYQVMNSVLRRSVEAYRANPWLAALRTSGDRSGSQPVANFSEDSFAAIEARQATADAISERERTPIVPLYADEKLRFASAWALAAPSQKAAMAAAMDKALGKYAPQFWNEIATKGQDGRALASVAAVAREDSTLARTILDGRAARVEEPKYAPKAEEAAPEYQSRFGAAFRNITPAGEAMWQEVIDIAAQLAKNDGNKTPGTTYLDRAMELRFGTRRLPTWRGERTVPPERGADLGEWMRTLIASDLGPSLPILPSTQRRIEPDVIARRAKIFAVGQGRYTVEIDGEELAGPDGRPFVLNYWNWKNRKAADDARRGSLK